MHSFRSDRTRPDHWSLKLLAIILGAWLFVVPQVMFSSTVTDLCEQAGSSTLPLIEEESAHHCGTEPVPSMVVLSSAPILCIDLPHLEDRILSSFHGDVPHLPPWA